MRPAGQVDRRERRRTLAEVDCIPGRKRARKRAVERETLDWLVGGVGGVGGGGDVDDGRLAVAIRL